MFVGKTRIVMLAVRVLEKFNSGRSKPFFKVTSRNCRISLTTKISQVNAIKLLIDKY